jgi:arylsulfatase
MKTTHPFLVANIIVLSCAPAVLSAEPAAETHRPPRKPDILFIMPDQWRGDCLSALEHPVVRTPTVDALAKAGALFRRAYSPVPSCIPARFALLTGQFPQTSGVVGYAGKPITTATLPGLLRDAGYATVLVGRNMHQVGKSDLGYQKQILGSTHVDNDAYDEFLQTASPTTGGIRKLVADLGCTFNGWRAAPWPLADNLHPTAWIVREARRIVEETVPEQALFLTASFYAPHPPLFPPKRDFDALLAGKLPTTPPHGDWVDWDSLPDAARVKGDAHQVRIEGDALRRAQAGYFGLIHQLDREVAPLIAAFQARSHAAGRPWLIIFTADHGEMLGDHGYFRKCEPFEGSANIPFIITGSPELGFHAGVRCTRPVCLEDVLPTLVEAAGARCPAGVDGVSLLPVLRGEEPRLREWLHFEHAPCYGPKQAFHALTDGRYKYIWRPADGTEHLFDLAADPREQRDLTRNAAQRSLVDAWRTRLVQRLASRPEGFSDGQRLIAGRPYRAIMAGKQRE